MYICVFCNHAQNQPLPSLVLCRVDPSAFQHLERELHDEHQLPPRRPLDAETQANIPAPVAPKDPFQFFISLHMMARAALGICCVSFLLGFSVITQPGARSPRRQTAFQKWGPPRAKQCEHVGGNVPLPHGAGAGSPRHTSAMASRATRREGRRSFS